MKQILNPKHLPWITLNAGGLGLIMRFWLYTTADDKGFVTRWHISAILMYLVMAVYLVLLIAATRSLTQGSKYRFNFPASPVGGIGALAAAVAFGITSGMDLFTAEDLFSRLTAIFGLLSMLALVFVGHARWKGRHPSTLFHVVICAWLVMRLFYMYRLWSSDPQLQDFCFQILALVCMMLAVYHRATFDANFGKRHSYVFFSLAAVFFCCLSLAGPENILFYLGAGCWLITDLCNLTPMPKREQKA